MKKSNVVFNFLAIDVKSRQSRIKPILLSTSLSNLAVSDWISIQYKLHGKNDLLYNLSYLKPRDILLTYTILSIPSISITKNVLFYKLKILMNCMKDNSWMKMSEVVLVVWSTYFVHASSLIKICYKLYAKNVTENWEDFKFVTC